MTNEQFRTNFDEMIGCKLGVQYVSYTPAEAWSYHLDRIRSLENPAWINPESPAKIGSVTTINRHNKMEVSYWDPVVENDEIIEWKRRHGNGCRFDGT